MLKITITGERYPIPRQIYLAGSYSEPETMAIIDESYEKEQALEIQGIDGIWIYIPFTTMQFITDFQVEEVNQA